MTSGAMQLQLNKMLKESVESSGMPSHRNFVKRDDNTSRSKMGLAYRKQMKLKVDLTAFKHKKNTVRMSESSRMET